LVDFLQLILNGVAGSYFHGDIAIDDVAFTRGVPCSKGPLYPSYATPPSQSTAAPTLPPFTPEVSGFVCNFNDGFCSWTNDQSDGYDWQLLTGKPGLSNTGPSGDYTTGTWIALCLQPIFAKFFQQ